MGNDPGRAVEEFQERDRPAGSAAGAGDPVTGGHRGILLLQSEGLTVCLLVPAPRAGAQAIFSMISGRESLPV